MKRYIAVLTGMMCSLAFIFPSRADGYRIRITIHYLPDSVCYLVNYLGDKTYLADTALVTDHAMVFEGQEPLKRGIYILAGQNKNKYLEFIVNDEQQFSLETDTAALLDHIKVKGSRENGLFFEYIHTLGGYRVQVDSLANCSKAEGLSDSTRNHIYRQIEAIDVQVKQYRQDLIERSRGTFLSVFLLAATEPPVFEQLGKSTQQTVYDSLFVLYKAHYWDNFDLNDERLLRSPLFHQRLSKYMEEMVVPIPDSITREIDQLMLAVEESPETYEYLLWYFTREYERSKYMGFDAVFVYLADQYFAKGKATGMNQTVVDNILDRARILKPLLIGKPAPEMILLDTNEVPVALSRVKAKYTLIYFWDTDCSFCKKESPRLKAFYAEKSRIYDLEVYAVCIDTSFASWKKYIRENSLTWINVNGYLSLTQDFHDLYDVHSSPVMYLLDEKKTIIAKHILTDQIPEIIERRETPTPSSGS